VIVVKLILILFLALDHILFVLLLRYNFWLHAYHCFVLLNVVCYRAMETVINLHGLDIEALKSSRLPLFSGPQIGNDCFNIA
jgi:hypothetical protein